MTAKEAIMILESIQPSCGEKYSFSESERYEAIDMAISALKGKDTNVPSRKGVFIPDITVEMFRNASLEGVEDLMASGEMEDISLPPAQPELIRCKDCKHYYFADNRIPQEQRYTCYLNGDRWKPDDFCSYSERRTDGER